MLKNLVVQLYLQKNELHQNVSDTKTASALNAGEIQYIVLPTDNITENI